MTNITLNRSEFDATIAALRLLATAIESKSVSPNDGDIGDILTNLGEHDGLNETEVHNLADQLLGIPA